MSECTLLDLFATSLPFRSLPAKTISTMLLGFGYFQDSGSLERPHLATTFYYRQRSFPDQDLHLLTHLFQPRRNRYIVVSFLLGLGETPRVPCAFVLGPSLPFGLPSCAQALFLAGIPVQRSAPSRSPGPPSPEASPGLRSVWSSR